MLPSLHQFQRQVQLPTLVAQSVLPWLHQAKFSVELIVVSNSNVVSNIRHFRAKVPPIAHPHPSQCQTPQCQTRDAKLLIIMSFPTSYPSSFPREVVSIKPSWLFEARSKDHSPVQASCQLLLLNLVAQSVLPWLHQAKFSVELIVVSNSNVVSNVRQHFRAKVPPIAQPSQCQTPHHHIISNVVSIVLSKGSCFEQAVSVVRKPSFHDAKLLLLVGIQGAICRIGIMSFPTSLFPASQALVVRFPSLAKLSIVA